MLKRKKNIWSQSLTGVILGAIISSTIAVWTTRENSKIQTKILKNQSIQGQKIELKAYITKQIELFEYFDDNLSRFEYYLSIQDSAKIKSLMQEIDLLKWTSELMEINYKIYLTSSSEFSEETNNLRDNLISSMDSIIEKNNRSLKIRMDIHDKVGMKFEKWLEIAKIELDNYDEINY